jgi:hypothetical protein
MRRAALLVAAAIALFAAGCGGTSRTDSRPAAERDSAGTTTARVSELTSIGQLRDAFNAHKHVPHLIVLASPT